MNRDKDNEILESYILGNLSKEEEKIIEDRLLNETELKKEYEYLLLLNKALLDESDLNEKMNFLKNISSQEFSFFIKYKQVLYVAASIVIIIGFSYPFLIKNDENINNDNRLKKSWGESEKNQDYKEEVSETDTIEWIDIEKEK